METYPTLRRSFYPLISYLAGRLRWLWSCHLNTGRHSRNCLIAGWLYYATCLGYHRDSSTRRRGWQDTCISSGNTYRTRGLWLNRRCLWRLDTSRGGSRSGIWRCSRYYDAFCRLDTSRNDCCSCCWGFRRDNSWFIACGSGHIRLWCHRIGVCNILYHLIRDICIPIRNAVGHVVCYVGNNSVCAVVLLLNFSFVLFESQCLQFITVIWIKWDKRWMIVASSWKQPTSFSTAETNILTG